MIIPVSDLSEDALEGLLESYIDREGTDYGEQELSREVKVNRLKSQVLKGSALIVFDPKVGEVNVLSKEEYASVKQS